MIRLFGRRNRRRGTGDGRVVVTRAVVVRALCTSLALVLAVACWPFVGDRLRRHPYFAVEEVVVRGHRRVAPDAIRRAAGIEPGTSIWDVDGAAVAARLDAEAWLRRAQVRRELPRRVVITVREERPIAILAVADGAGAPHLYYLAARARIFAPVRPAEPRDFPYVTGLEAGDLAGDQAFGPRAIRRALGLLRIAARSGPVSEVHVHRTRGLTLLPVRPTVPIELGWGRFADKLARLPPVLARWKGRETEIASVSLEFDPDVIVRTRAQPTPPAPARRAERT